MKLVLLDANLLVLLVVGAVNVKWLDRHKRVRAFNAGDWRLLLRLIDGKQLVTSPHILTETSNLLRSGGLSAEATRKLMSALAIVVVEASEGCLPARDIVKQQIYERFGLTDAAILSLTTPDVHLLTADDELWCEALALGKLASNFTLVRELEGRWLS